MKRALFVGLAVALIACKQSAPPPTAQPAPAPSAQPSAQPAAPATQPQAKAADPWSKPAPKKDPLARPLFWSIEKDGKTSYALGTIHLGVDAEARLPQIVWDKIDASPAFAMETDLNDPALKTVLECIGCSLKKELGPVYWKKLEAELTPAVAARVDSMKPMVAATMMSIRGLPMTTQMDTLLLARATTQKKTILYLEEPSVQAAILEKHMNVKALKAMLDDVEGGQKHTKLMLDAYTSGDEVAMVKLSESEREQSLKHGYTAKEYDATMQDMLYGRNASWIPAIEKAHAAGGIFIAAGAMHLVGPKNVLELLQKKGYKITRVVP
jgi:uncharacterized protein YbaP (TraB family)